MLPRGTPGPGGAGRLRKALAVVAVEERRCWGGTARPSARCQKCAAGAAPLSASEDAEIWSSARPRSAAGPDLWLSPEGRAAQGNRARTSLETEMSYGAKSFCVWMAGKPARRRGETGAGAGDCAQPWRLGWGFSEPHFHGWGGFYGWALRLNATLGSL